MAYLRKIWLNSLAMSSLLVYVLLFCLRHAGNGVLIFCLGIILLIVLLDIQLSYRHMTLNLTFKTFNSSTNASISVNLALIDLHHVSRD